MRIDSGLSYLGANGTQSPAAAKRTDASFAAALAATTQSPTHISSAPSQKTAESKPTDFTSMTRQQMRDWVNTQIQSGQMSLDDSSPLMAMTMKISVDTGIEVPAGSDTEQIDFTNRARQGIAAALSRNEPENAKRLQVALDLLLKHQGETFGVNTHA
ncbi:hypothetical protein PIN31009_00950 [Pandoraea iniqua]|uniref:hypothetical protein n=1 Tax=Pandoraea iniqua TaxID=2508288 RepID=UPI001241594F|nr:hypothetical protein [Pandoraea iniqua]VVD77386.1 hypothetical protein PIN31009_00950 [Pandoraea iniqua]